MKKTIVNGYLWLGVALTRLGFILAVGLILFNVIRVML